MKCSLIHPLKGLAIAGLIASAGGAWALQTVEGRDGVSVDAAISIKEPTRIKVEGASITDVFGNIYSSNCGGPAPVATPKGGGGAGINHAGEVVLECDRDKGEIYVKPVGNGTKPVNLFISTANATYTLILRRVDMPADTIVVRDRSVVAAAAATAGNGRMGGAGNHVKSIKTLNHSPDAIARGLNVAEQWMPRGLRRRAKWHRGFLLSISGKRP